jgi:hypothetical protein
MLNSMIYEVEFPDGQVKEYGASIIAENMLTQVDEKAVALEKKNDDTFGKMPWPGKCSTSVLRSRSWRKACKHLRIGLR